MPRTPVDLSTLLTWVNHPQAVAHLRSYYDPDRTPGKMPYFAGSRFEFFAGGGDRAETANRITLDDLSP